MEQRAMGELLTIDATPIEGQKIPQGTEVKIYASNGKLVAKANGVPVAYIPKRYESVLRNEPDKHCTAGVRVGDVLPISVMVPVLRAKYRGELHGVNGAYRLTGDEITYYPNTNESETHTVKNVTATVESGEELRSRVTVTRMLLVGALAFAMKKDSGGVLSRFLRTFRQPHRPALRCGYPSSSVTSR